MKSLKSIIKKATLPLIFLGSSLVYGQEKGTMILVNDNNKDKIADEYVIIKSSKDSIHRKTISDLDFNQKFDIVKTSDCGIQDYKINEKINFLEEGENPLKKYSQLKIGKHLGKKTQDDLQKIIMRLKYSEMDSSLIKIEALDEDKDGNIDKYCLFEESKNNIFNINYLNEDNDSIFEKIVLKEYNKKKDFVSEKSFAFNKKIPEEFKKLKIDKPLGKGSYLDMEAIKITAWDNNHDSIIDEYFFFEEKPGKVIQMVFKDANLDGKFDQFMGFSYNEKTNSISMDLPKDYMRKFELTRNLDLKHGNNYFYCKRNHFRSFLKDYIKR